MPTTYPLQYPRPTALDGLRQTSFSGLSFPVEGIDLHSQGRQHLHEYPHSPGAAPEKLGRGIWYISVRTTFDVGLPGYPVDLWPTTMNTLRGFYENQQTATFVHPSTGEFQAFISGWRQNYNPKRRSGEKVEIEFIEDQRTNFLAQTKPNISVSALVTTQSELDAALALVKPQLGMSQNDASIFDAIRATSNAISALSDTAGLYSQFVQAKGAELQGFCQQVDMLPSMQGPLALSVLDLMKTLWSTAVKITQVDQTQTKIAHWTVPRPMTIQDIAMRLYNGDASRASDILRLNANQIPDPNSVRPGITLQYFIPAATT